MCYQIKLIKTILISAVTLTVMLLLGCVDSNKGIKYQGYIEGKYIELAASRPGILQSLAVSPGQWVTAGQLAFRLDPQPEFAELQQAQATLQAEQNNLLNLEKGERDTILLRLRAQKQFAEAQLAQDSKTLTRYLTLFQKDGIAKAQLDDAQANVLRAQAKLREATANLNEAAMGARADVILSQQARVNTAKAAVVIAEWNLTHKTAYIPQDGYIDDTYYEANEYIQTGQPILSLLTPQNIEIIFFIPEAVLSKIKHNQLITVSCDSCTKIYSAKIISISSKAEYTPPVIFSEHTTDKLLYKIRASFNLKNVAILFHPGQPVNVYLALK